MDDYISKPIFFDTLQRTLVRWARASKAGTASLQAGNVVEAEAPSDFNPQAIAELESIAPGLSQRMIALFLNDESPALLAQLHQAAKCKDASQIEYTAHTLKSSSSILGAKAFAGLCFQLEIVGRQQQLDKIEGLTAELDRLFPSVVAYLEDYLARSAATQ